MPGSSRADEPGNPAAATAAGTIFDISGIDLSARARDAAEIERWIPHRGSMRLIDAIVWEDPANCRGVAVRRVPLDEFWVAGHFPGRPLMPGVVMIEAGAQLACYLYVSRKPLPCLVAFLRIENCAFRSMVRPGDELFLLCNGIKVGRRQFQSKIQGLVDGRVTFDAEVTGMMLDPPPENLR